MTIANPRHLLSLLQAFINAPSWAESRRILEDSPELLTEEADALLGDVMVHYQEDAQVVRILEEHRDLLRRCRAEGVASAFASYGDTDPELQAILAEIGPVSSEAELEEKLRDRPDLWERLEAMQQASVTSREAELEDLLIEWVQTPTWADSHAYLESHLELLTDEAEKVLADLAAIQEQEGARHTLDEHLTLLHRCREEGIESGFATRMGGVELPRELRAVVERLGPELGRQLLEIMDRASSEEEFEAELEELPELRAVLAQASIGTGAVRGDARAEIAPILQELARTDQRTNLPRRVDLCRQALHYLNREQDPELWTALKNELASSLAQSRAGERAENLEQAIHHYKQVLEVYTRRADPERWAMTQHNLANAYRDRIRGNRADNLEQAIHHCTHALEVYTRQANPERWAATQHNLASVYYFRIRGDRAQNIEIAIHHNEQALEIRTRQADPERWAMTQHNLALAYANRIRGDGADNLEHAIHHAYQALEVFTHQAFPADWAAAQINLANTYLGRIHGDRSENLEQAIHHSARALEVYTRQADPERWAQAVNNLAVAYVQRIRGDRADNLERAIQHFSQVLEVRTRDAFPVDWAQTVNNLANAYAQRIRGDRTENLERAIHHLSQVLEVRTRQAFPTDWAQTVNNLALAYADRIRGDRAQNVERAIHYYNQALDVYSRQAFPADWAMIQHNLANAYSDRIRGDRAENVERAITHCNQALEVYTRQAFPERWAGIQSNLANAYHDRIGGKRAENLEQAIHHYAQALEIYTPQARPEWARNVSRRLGSAHFAVRDWAAAHAAFAQARSLTEDFYADALLREVREQEAGGNAAMYAQDAFCLAKMGDLLAAWTSLETGRARALRQGLDQARARRALSSADPALRERYEMLTGRERDLNDALGRPEEDPLHRAYPLVRDELASLREELRRLQEGLLARAGIEIGLPGLGAMQELRLLQDGRTGLLSLAVTEHGTLALLLTAQGMREAVVPDLTEADLGTLTQGPDDEPGWGGWLGAYLSQFEALRAARDEAFWAALMSDSQERLVAAQEAHAAWQVARERWRDTISETLAVLGRRLWPDLDEMLQDANCERIVLVPQGMLLLLPLHACPLKGDERLCDRYTVAYTPAGAVLRQLVREEITVNSPQALLVANPTGDLRHTLSEALAVGQTFDTAVTLWKQDATQAQVVVAARDADILHISGHGVYDWLKPERSGLLLAGGGSDQQGDLFSVAEMRDELRLSRAQLVTLSACETGLVDLRRGLADEYLGLPGILLQAGARAVVASLWAVDDLATALLMRRFYTEWQAGAVSIAAALQRAQTWLRTRSRAQVEEALAELDEAWEPWRHQEGDPAMKRRAVEQYWEILAARRRLRDEMPDLPFAHPYWWAAFQAVGDVL